MAETSTPTKKRKPLFLRRDWYKKIKLGKGIKKKQKWRAAKGRQNKTRLGRKGYGTRPKIGYGESIEIKNKVQGLIPVRVENIADLEKVGAGQGVIIANVGKKKRTEIMEKAKEKKLTILNKYKEKKE